MRYAITHLTHFAYESAVLDSHMEVRMHPLTDSRQTCLAYAVRIDPRARPHSYLDYLGNAVDCFSVPGRHQALTVIASSEVQVERAPQPPASLDPLAWAEVDEWSRRDAHWDLRQPSARAAWSPALTAYAEAVAGDARSVDPLIAVRRISAAVHRDFAYAPNTTSVDTTIDEVLTARRGVCQDLSHVTLGVLRRLGLPARYVSGYIAPAIDGDAGVAPSNATHAWVEVLLPGLDWLGFDPTNDCVADERHIRVAVGRDYADVPPTRGVHKGDAASTLTVSITISAPGMTAGATPIATTPQARPEQDVAGLLQQRQQQQ